MKTMATIKDICRLCLQETDPYNSRLIDMRKLCVLWKVYQFDKMDASFYRNHIICDSCLSSFKALKTMFLNTKNSHAEIMQECKRTQLSKINLKKMKKYSSMTEDFLVCRLCCKPTKEVSLRLYDSPENILPMDYIRKMLETCKVHMNFEKTINPVSCQNCWENIQVVFSFRKQLERINANIFSYANALHKSLITREDLQKVVDVYSIEDPIQIKTKLDSLVKIESSYCNTFYKFNDIKPKIEPDSPTSEKYLNQFKQIIRDGPIDDIHYKPITEYDDIPKKRFVNDINFENSLYENNKIVLNPYHDIDKVVVNPFYESDIPVQVPNPFHDIENQRVIHFNSPTQHLNVEKVVVNLFNESDKPNSFRDNGNQSVNNFHSPSQHLEDNFELDVCETQHVDRLTIREDHSSELPKKTSFVNDKSVPSDNIVDEISFRTDLQIKKEIVWDEEEVYIKKEVFSDHENSDRDIEDDMFIENGSMSERLNLEDLDVCPSLDATIKSESSTHPEENTMYDIHYIEHFDQGPPTLEPQIPCVVEKKILIGKIAALKSQHDDLKWSPKSSGNMNLTKRGRGRPRKHKNLPVRNLIQEMSKTILTLDERVTKINPLAKKKVTKSTKKKSTHKIVTRSTAKTKPETRNENMSLKLGFKRKLEKSDIEKKDQDFLSHKKLKKESKQFEKQLDDVKKTRKVHIFDVNAQNVLKTKSINKNLSLNKKINTTRQNTPFMKIPLNRNVSLKSSMTKGGKKIFKKNPLNQYNTRSGRKNTVLNKVINKTDDKKFLRNPLNRIHTRSTLKKSTLNKELTKMESSKKNSSRNAERKSILGKESPKLAIKQEKVESMFKIKTDKSQASKLAIKKDKTELFKIKADKSKMRGPNKINKNETKSRNVIEDILKGNYSVFNLNEHKLKNSDLVKKHKKIDDLTNKKCNDQILKHKTDHEICPVINMFGEKPGLKHFENESAENKINLKNKRKSFILDKELFVNVPKLGIMDNVGEKKKVNKDLNGSELDQNNMPQLDSDMEKLTETKPDITSAVTAPKSRMREKRYFSFQCDLCEFRTYNAKGAEMHKARHKNNNLRTCPACPYQTSLFSCLNKHYQVAHPGEHLDFLKDMTDSCFSCHRKCTLKIRCGKCKNFFHFGCFYKKSALCQHVEDVYIKEENTEHDYSLPPSAIQERRPSQNPPILQEVQPIKNLPSTSNSLQNSQLSPPLLERQHYLPENGQNDLKPVIPKSVTAARIPSVAPAPQIEAVTNEPVLHQKPFILPQNRKLFENLYTDLRVKPIVQNQPLSIQSGPTSAQISQSTRPFLVKDSASMVPTNQNSVPVKRIPNSTQSQPRPNLIGASMVPMNQNSAPVKRIPNSIQSQPRPNLIGASRVPMNQNPVPVKKILSSTQSQPRLELIQKDLLAKKTVNPVQSKTGLKNVLYPVKRPVNTQNAAIQPPILRPENVESKPEIAKNSLFKISTFNKVSSDFQRVQNIVTKKNSRPNMDGLDFDNAVVCFDVTSKQIKQEVLDSFDITA